MSSERKKIIMIMTKDEEEKLMQKVELVAKTIDIQTQDMHDVGYILKKLVESYEEYFNVEIPFRGREI